MARRYLKQARPQMRADRRALEDRVRAILDDIATHGDAAVQRYAREFDGRHSPDFRVTGVQYRRVDRILPATFKEDLAYADPRATEFAKVQRDSMHEFQMEIEPGIERRRATPRASTHSPFAHCRHPAPTRSSALAARRRSPPWRMAALA